MRDREYWLEDFFDHMVPPSSFALLVAEAVDDCMPRSDWIALTGPNADEKLRDALRQMYAESVWPKFVKRYGFSYPVGWEESAPRGTRPLLWGLPSTPRTPNGYPADPPVSLVCPLERGQ